MCLIFIVSTILAFCGVFSAAEAGETDVLPQGIRAGIFRTIQVDLNSHFGNTGDLTEFKLNERLNTRVVREGVPEVRAPAPAPRGDVPQPPPLG